MQATDLDLKLCWYNVLQLALHERVEDPSGSALPVHQPWLGQVAGHAIELKLGSVDLHGNICMDRRVWESGCGAQDVEWDQDMEMGIRI